MTTAAENELRELLTAVTHRDVARLSADDDLVEVLGIDSLCRLRLLAMVEKRYDVRFPDEELSGFRTLDRVVRFLKERGKV